MIGNASLESPATGADLNDPAKPPELNDALFAACPDAIALADAAGKVFAVNQAARRCFGLSHEVPAELTLSELIAPAHRAAVMADRQGRADGTARTTSLDAVRRDGTVFPAQLSLARRAVGGGSGYVAFFRDMSEQRAVETALRVSEGRLTAFFDHVPAGLYLKDADGRYLLVNADVLRRLQRPLDQVIGRSAWDLWDEGVASRSEQQDQRVLKSGRPFTAEETYVQRHTTTYMSGTRFVVPDEYGNMTNIGGILMDITDRKVAEDEAKKSREALHQSEKLTALGSLLAGVSHELNNPLAAVIGQAMMLEEDAEGTELADRAIRIRSAAERCVRIVQVFLAMARQQPARRGPLDLNDVAKNALELAAYAMRTSGVIVDAVFHPDLPPAYADSDQIHQVMLNLLINAQQALADQGSERRLSVITRRSVDSRQVEIEVSDNGPGIEEEIAKRIFEPFFTTKDIGAGTGVGLSFSLGVVEANGGKLRLDQIGPGATFVMSLPIADAAAREGDNGRSRIWPRVGSKGIVVDDEEEVAIALAAILERAGYTIERSTDPVDALGRVALHHFDFAITDLRMPGMSGAAFHHRLREIDAALADAAGIMTGDVLNAGALDVLRAIDRPYMEKPFTMASVHALMRRLLPEA